VVATLVARNEQEAGWWQQFKVVSPHRHHHHHHYPEQKPTALSPLTRKTAKFGFPKARHTQAHSDVALL
jgi:hypothetical protein